MGIPVAQLTDIYHHRLVTTFIMRFSTLCAYGRLVSRSFATIVHEFCNRT